MLTIKQRRERDRKDLEATMQGKFDFSRYGSIASIHLVERNALLFEAAWEMGFKAAKEFAIAEKRKRKNER